VDIKNKKFDADFESVEKVAKKLMQKKVSSDRKMKLSF
jgi:hypothetical protein